MKEDLKFDFFKVNKSNLMHALNPSIREFYESSEEKASILFNRYQIACSHKEIIHCTLKSNGKLLSSCILVSTVLALEIGNKKGLFLTQVVTEKGHRQQGLLKILLAKVEELCQSRDVSLMLVIARRAAGDIYWKLGFQGFSHFPRFVNEKRNQLQDKRGLRRANFDDLWSLKNAHQNSRYLSNLRILRTENDWRDLILLQSSSNNIIWVDIKEHVNNYAIYRNSTLIEASSNLNPTLNREFFLNLEKSSQEVLLDRNHPITTYLSNKDWHYSERYEPREGHLLKIVGEDKSFLSSLSRGKILQKSEFWLEISPIDQW